jgi:transcriptional/translational regulatory protein YebC/TACO1
VGGCVQPGYQTVGLACCCEAAADGAAVLFACAGDVKSAITKGGGKAADSGSVMFNFMRQVRQVAHKQAAYVFQHAVLCCGPASCAVLCAVLCCVLSCHVV